MGCGGQGQIPLGIRSASVKPPSLSAHFKKEETNRPTAAAAAAAASERVRVREAAKAAGPARRGRKEGRSEKIGGRQGILKRVDSESGRGNSHATLLKFPCGALGQNRESFKMAEKRARR